MTPFGVICDLCQLTKDTNVKSLISIEAENRARQADLKTEQWDREQADKNPPFLQLSKSHFPQYRELARRSPAAWQVLGIMAEKMNRQNAIACSQQTLAKITGYSLPTVKRAIALLQAERWIQIIKFGTANAYVVNAKVFWQSSREGRYAVFSANIIADAAEQTTTPEEWDEITLKHVPIMSAGEQIVLVGPDEAQKELEV